MVCLQNTHFYLIILSILFIWRTCRLWSIVSRMQCTSQRSLKRSSKLIEQSYLFVCILHVLGVKCSWWMDGCDVYVSVWYVHGFYVMYMLVLYPFVQCVHGIYVMYTWVLCVYVWYINGMYVMYTWVLCVCVCPRHSTGVEVRGQHARVSCLLPPCDSQELNLGCPDWQESAFTHWTISLAQEMLFVFSWKLKVHKWGNQAWHGGRVSQIPALCILPPRHLVVTSLVMVSLVEDSHCRLEGSWRVSPSSLQGPQSGYSGQIIYTTTSFSKGGWEMWEFSCACGCVIKKKKNRLRADMSQYPNGIKCQ